MKNLFENLKNGSKVTSNNLTADLRLNVGGDITINKGVYSETISFYCQITEMIYEGFVNVEDMDINDTIETSFNGIPIDNEHSFKEGLKNLGLTTVAQSLEIEYKDQVKQVAIQLSKNKRIKAVFGEDVKFWGTLSESEQDIVKLEYAIKNYKTLPAYANCISKYVVVEDGTKIKPELKVLKTALKELKSK
jgi:hypothetical protein